MQASHLNTYYLVTFVSFFKSKKTQRMRKKWVVKGKLIKILHHCSLPQTSRLDSSNPAQANVSKSIANLSCRCPAYSSLHGPVLFTSFGLPPLSLPLFLLLLLLHHLMFQDSISYKYTTTQYNLLPLIVTRRRFLQSPEPTSQRSQIRCYCQDVQIVQMHRALSFSSNWGVKWGNVKYSYCVIV